MPDEELLRAAERSTLRKPGVLEAQVRRMLDDPKSQALVQDFGGQWLQIRGTGIGQARSDSLPERWDEYLRLSMRRETELFFEHIVERGPQRSRLPRRRLHVPQRAAGAALRHPRRRGTGVPQGGPDGHASAAAILTHASVLTVSSYATRTSPVLRGKWILDNLLNTPPPSAAGRAGHRRGSGRQDRVAAPAVGAAPANPACASCHARMDPLGFSMENFNAIGAWRDKDGEFPIDAVGHAAGRTDRSTARAAEDDPEGRRRRVRRGPDRKMLTLRAGPRPGAGGPPGGQGDRRRAPAAASIGSRAWCWAIVESEPFQTRRGEEVTP